MIRRYTIEQWLAKSPDRQRLVARFGAVERPPLARQIGKSAAKKALLKKLYGETGQPGRAT
ncbi:MAG: hypothetical protein LBK71_10320 [Verrucomicrobiales bacterium]|jgi:hypothetical protein|nr:hypothetical protein [Verrucomicrobiales bacterium]